MASKFLEPAKALIKKHEHYRQRLYKDSMGITTGGWGHNMTNGLSKAAWEFVFEEDFKEAHFQAAKYPWFHRLTPERKQVIVNMMFNLGPNGFGTFKKMIAALEREDYEAARFEMLSSLWRVQVGSRATELAKMMYPTPSEAELEHDSSLS